MHAILSAALVLASVTASAPIAPGSVVQQEIRQADEVIRYLSRQPDHCIKVVLPSGMPNDPGQPMHACLTATGGLAVSWIQWRGLALCPAEFVARDGRYEPPHFDCPGQPRVWYPPWAAQLFVRGALAGLAFATLQPEMSERK